MLSIGVYARLIPRARGGGGGFVTGDDGDDDGADEVGC